MDLDGLARQWVARDPAMGMGHTAAQVLQMSDSRFVRG
jgi:hypothetical protein